MSKLSQIESIERGKGLQRLLDCAYAILQKPLVLFDARYSLLAYTGVAADDPIWCALVATGSHGIETQRFFANEYFFDNIADGDRHFLLMSNKLKYARMMGHILNGEGVKVIFLVMLVGEAPFRDDDVTSFDKLMDVITEEIAGGDYYDYYIEYGRAFHEEVIVKLLDGAIDEPLVFTPQTQILYDGFNEYLYLAVVEAGEGVGAGGGSGGSASGGGSGSGGGAGHRDHRDRAMRLLRSTFPSYKYARYADYIIMLMSSKYRVAYEELFQDKFRDLFEQHNLRAGISGSFENLYDLREHYDNAAEALQNGQRPRSAHRIFIC